MCGIAGIFNFSDNKINPEIANIMGASLEHRGPDFSDIQFIKNNVVFILDHKEFKKLHLQC